MLFAEFYTFYNDLLVRIKNRDDLGLDELHLVGSRKSGKSMNAQIFCVRACDLYDKDGKPIQCDTFAFRYETQDRAELFNDFLQALNIVAKERPNMEFKIKKDRIYFPRTKSHIRIYGLTTRNTRRIKKTGLSHSNAEYIFKFLEERAEFPSRDIQDVDEAVRGIGFNRTLTICASNPRTLNNEYISWCNSQLKFSEGILRNAHFQLLKKDVMLDENIKRRHVFIYNN
jgi:hypothetical protein